MGVNFFKYLTAFLFVLIFQFNGLSQTRIWGNPIKIKGSAIYSKVMEENEHGIFLLRYANPQLKKFIVLERYSADLNLQKMKNIDLKKHQVLKLSCTRRGILLVTGLTSKITGSMEIFGRWYDYDLSLIQEPKVITKLDRKEVLDGESFRLRVDSDRSLLSISTMENYVQQRPILKFKLYSLDFNLLYEQEYEMPPEPGDFHLNDYQLSSSGDILAIVYRKKGIGKKENRHWYFLEINKNQKRLTSFPDDKWYKNLYIHKIEPRKEFLISGFYGDVSSESLKGYFFYRLNNKTTDNSFIFREFNEDLWDKITSSKKTIKKSKLLERYEILQIIPRTDGGVLLVAEQKSIMREDDLFLSYGIPQVTARNIFQYDDLLILNLDSNFNVDWSHVIRKNQTTVNDGGYNSSVVIFVLNQFIQIYYNDPNSRNGDVLQYTIYWDGEYTAKKAFNDMYEQIYILPNESTQVASNKMIMPTVKNRKFALLKIVF
jgi:hypothetical protein